MSTFAAHLNEVGQTVDLLETDHELIRSFEWVGDDNPLPIDPLDYSQLQRGLAWAASAISGLTHDIFVDEFDGEADAEESDDLAYMRRDLKALTAFRDALARRIKAIRDREQVALQAWVTGAPIR
jgi:hypothetical protein